MAEEYTDDQKRACRTNEQPWNNGTNADLLSKIVPKAKAQSKPTKPVASDKKVAIGPKKSKEASKGASPKKTAVNKKTSNATVKHEPR